MLVVHCLGAVRNVRPVRKALDAVVFDMAPKRNLVTFRENMKKLTEGATTAASLESNGKLSAVFPFFFKSGVSLWQYLSGTRNFMLTRSVFRGWCRCCLICAC